METYLEFIKKEKQRLNVMTQARIELCCKAINVNTGYHCVEGLHPRTVTERSKAL